MKKKKVKLHTMPNLAFHAQLCMIVLFSLRVQNSIKFSCIYTPEFA